MSEWRTVSIRQELIKEIEKTIKKGQYRSLSEFISEAIRLRLEEFMRAEATSAERPQETLNMKDGTLKVSTNVREEEKAQPKQPTLHEETQSQPCQALALLQQKGMVTIPK
jgi:Arc/MetJ-type ribon-helix-helix transcriptional regulator